MDFWGFEGRHRHELPGEEFMFLDPPTPSPPPAVPTPPPAVPTPPPPPAVVGGRVEGTPAVTTGTPAPSTLRVNPSREFTAAQGTLDRRYEGVTAIFDAHGVTGAPSTSDFRAHPEHLTSFWGEIRNNPRYASTGPNPWPSSLDGDITNLAGDQTAYNAARTEMEGTADHPPATRTAADEIAGRADTALRNIGTHTLSTSVPGRGPDGGPLPEPPPDPNQPSALVRAAQGFQEGAYLGNSIAGAANSVANIGMAGRNIGAAFGAQSGGGGGFGGDQFGGGFGGGGGGFGGVGDLTGTNFGIESQSSDYRAQARKTDRLLNMLIMMIASGNTDAITSAFILLSQKSKQTLAHVSLSMIGSMRQYDNQMRSLSDQMGAISSNNPNSNSQLAGLNSQFQIANSGRQMIMNMGRDVMSSVEEFNNVEKSVLDQMTRSRSTYSRWT